MKTVRFPWGDQLCGPLYEKPFTFIRLEADQGHKLGTDFALVAMGSAEPSPFYCPNL